MLRALTLVLLAATTATAFGQGACCAPAPQPMVAFSPVVAAPAPAVVQTTTVSSGWYPGKYLSDFTRNLFGVNDTTTTVVTPATFAPATVSAGYAPTYTAGFTPSVAYRPTYPASFGPVTQTVSRPVVLSPVASSPVMAASGCDACSTCGVEQAYYSSNAGYSNDPGGCSACSAGSSYVAPAATPEYAAPSSGDSYPSGGGYDSLDNRPGLPSDANVPDERSNLKPEPADGELFDDEQTDPSAASDYFSPPPLFAPPSNNNVARRTHPAPVRTAVYRQQADASRTAFRPASGADASRPQPVQRLGADGWRSATD
ncbi:hypothetical protein [Botrimarina sp.]|uniref:hypothetical protein n=1 Tax=Botrimarina sp. TaxID=2795802 RepID=UPI0032EC5BE5